MPISALRSIAHPALCHLGYVAVQHDQWRHLRTIRAVHKKDVVEIEELYRRFVFPDQPHDPRRAEALHELHGTTVGEAIYLVHHLHQARAVPGEVCEFGCNEGATSRLLTQEILPDPARTLWLFDSFEGLPAPTEKDRPIDDIARLGSMWRIAARCVPPRTRCAASSPRCRSRRNAPGWSRAGSTTRSPGPTCQRRSVSPTWISTSTSRCGMRSCSSTA